MSSTSRSDFLQWLLMVVLIAVGAVMTGWNSDAAAVSGEPRAIGAFCLGILLMLGAVLAMTWHIVRLPWR